MAGGVARRRLEPDIVVESVVVGDNVGLTGLDHRQYAVVDAAVGIFFPFLVQLRPKTELGFGEHVARVGKGWHPAPVHQPCVPADVIGVQMGTHDEIDVVH